MQSIRPHTPSRFHDALVIPEFRMGVVIKDDKPFSQSYDLFHCVMVSLTDRCASPESFCSASDSGLQFITAEPVHKFNVLFFFKLPENTRNHLACCTLRH